MQKRFYTEQEVGKLEQYIRCKSLRDATIFRVGLDTNLSVTDLLSLKTTDVIKLGNIKSSLQIKTKKGPLKKVDLSEKSIDLLEHFTDQLIDEDGDFFYLFESKKKKGEPISNSYWKRILKNYCEEIGIGNKTPSPSSSSSKIVFTFPSQIENKLKAIQRFLSHKNHSISLKAKQEILASLKSLLNDGSHNNLSYPTA